MAQLTHTNPGTMMRLLVFSFHHKIEFCRDITLCSHLIGRFLFLPHFDHQSSVPRARDIPAKNRRSTDGWTQGTGGQPKKTHKRDEHDFVTLLFSARIETIKYPE